MKIFLFLLINIAVIGWYFYTFRNIKHWLFLLLQLAPVLYLGIYNWYLGIDVVTLFDLSLIGLSIFIFQGKRVKLSCFAKLILFLEFLFIAWSLLSALISSVNINYSYGGMILYLKSFLVFIILYYNIKNMRDFNAALYSLFVALFFEASLGFYQWRWAATGISFLRDYSYYRSAGTFKLPNLYGGYLIIIIPTVLVVLTIQPLKLKWRSIFLVLLAGVSILALLASYSRSAWIGFIFQITILILLLLRQKKVKRRIFKFAIVLSLLLSPVFAIYGERMVTRFETVKNSLNSRDVLVDAAKETIAKHPIFGVGLKNYARYGYPKWLNRPLSARNPENTFLLIAVESGLPALFFFILILLQSIVKGFFVLGNVRDKYFIVITASILSSFIGFVIQNIGVPEFRHFPIQVLLWFEIALLARIEALDKLMTFRQKVLKHSFLKKKANFSAG